MSVTLTALNSVPVSSSTTATLLTPSSLMSFIESSTVLLEVAAMISEYMLSEGRESDWRLCESSCVNEGVFSEYWKNQERSWRSETMPR